MVSSYRLKLRVYKRLKADTRPVYPHFAIGAKSSRIYIRRIHLSSYLDIGRYIKINVTDIEQTRQFFRRDYRRCAAAEIDSVYVAIGRREFGGGSADLLAHRFQIALCELVFITAGDKTAIGAFR